MKLSIALFLIISTVSSGSVTINDDSSVQILAEEAHPVDRLDAAVSISYCCYSSSWFYRNSQSNKECKFFVSTENL